MANIELKAVLAALAEDTSPANAADFLLSYDTSATDIKKLKPQSVLQSKTLVTALTAETVPASGDYIIIYDASADALRKMTRSDFLSGLGGGASSPLSLTANNTTETALTLKNASGQSAAIFKILNSIDTELLSVSGEGYGVAYLNVHGRVQLTAGTDSALTIGDATFSNSGGSAVLGFNSGQSVFFKDNNADVHFQFDNNHSANQTGLLLFADGSMKRIKLDTASGGKRTLYVDA